MKFSLIAFSVQIFVQYYKEVTPGVDFASEVLNDLLVSLLNNCLLQEVFQILNVIVQIKTLVGDFLFFKSWFHNFSFLSTMLFIVIGLFLLWYLNLG